MIWKTLHSLVADATDIKVLKPKALTLRMEPPPIFSIQEEMLGLNIFPGVRILR